MVLYGKNDELVHLDSILNLKKRLSMQKNIDVKFESISNANHFYKNKEKELAVLIDHYIKDKVTSWYKNIYNNNSRMWDLGN